MSTSAPQAFTGISSCIPNFDSSSCLIKTIQFSLSTIILLTTLGLLFNYIKTYGFLKGKGYINIILLFMLFYLISNMIFCFWNNIYELYSIETYFNNLYFLTIVIYMTRSYLIKENIKNNNKGLNKKQEDSRTSMISRQSKQSSITNDVILKKNKSIFSTNWFNKHRILLYKILYKSMAVIFFILFTMIFITSLIGDIQSNQNNTPIAQGVAQQNQNNQLFSFFKNSCQEIWYLCIQAICVVLSLIVLIILYKNYKFQQHRLKRIALVTTTIHQKRTPFEIRQSRLSYPMPARNIFSSSNLNNPLMKLSIWIGFNILGEIVDLVQSGLLLNANIQTNCQIITSSASSNSILKLFFVIFSVYLQYVFTLWFFYESFKKKKNIGYDEKNQKLLIQSNYQYSQQIRVGHIQMNPSFSKTHSSGSN